MKTEVEARLRDEGEFLRERARAKQLQRSLVSAGGVSMGAYQAGRLQSFINEARVEVLREVFNAEGLKDCPVELHALDPQLSQVITGTEWGNLGFDQVAGASAGGINAVGFALEVCRDTLVPTFAEMHDEKGAFLAWDDSILRRIWLDVGFDESPDPNSWTGKETLLDETDADTNKNALFSGGPLREMIVSLEKFFSANPPTLLRSGCQMGVSFPVTPLAPITVGDYFETLTLPVVVDFLIENGRAVVKPPVSPKGLAPYLTVRGEANAFLHLAQATGALPGALPLVAVEAWQDVGGPIALISDESNSRTTYTKVLVKPGPSSLWLADGGVFNNNPLDLVLARSVGNPQIYFLDHHRKLSEAPPFRGEYEGSTLWVIAQRLMASLGGVLTSQQVVAALRRQPDIEILGRHQPALSDAGFATSGFLHRSFRELDYLSGHLDGRDHPALHHETRGDSPSPLPTWTARDLDVLAKARASSCDPVAHFPGFHGQGRWSARHCALASASKLREQTRKQYCDQSRKDAPAPANQGGNQTGDVTQQSADELPNQDAQDACEGADQLSSLFDEFSAFPTEKSDLKEEVETRLEQLGRRLDALVAGQQGVWDIPARVIDLALESLLIDGLAPDGASDEKGRRLLRSWLPGPSVGVVFSDPDLGAELGLRLPGALGWALGRWGAIGAATPRLSMVVGGRLGQASGNGVVQQASASFTLLAFELEPGVRLKVDPTLALRATDEAWLGAGPTVRLDLLGGLYLGQRFLWGADGPDVGIYTWQSALGWDF